MCALEDSSLQASLNDAFRGRCVKEDGRWSCCGYHENRAACVAFKMTDDTLEATGHNNARALATPDLRKIARLVQTDTPPAGGWYLVREQREWLAEQLHEAFEDFCESGAERRIRLLEAGVASFVHHFTFVAIVQDVLEGFDGLEADVVVVDRCGFPLEQIERVHRKLNEQRTPPKRIKVGARSIPVPASLRPLLSSRRRAGSRISLKAVPTDLAQPKGAPKARADAPGEGKAGVAKVDVITEHFLTSVMDKKIRNELFKSTRETYYDFLQPGGRVLAAVGFRRRRPAFRSLVRAHREAGFALHPSSTEAVWDPYGLTSAQIADFQRNAPVGVSLDNTLARFDKAS